MSVVKNKFIKNTIKGRGKSGGDADDVYLVPPQTSDVYRSTSNLRSLDVLCEGPIEGLCLSDGRRAEGIDVFGAVYFDETPIKEDTEKSYTAGSFGSSNIQLVDRVSLSSLTAALNNIQSNLNSFINGGNDTSQGLASIAVSNISSITDELSDLFSNFDEYESLANQLGIIQFNVNGVITDTNSSTYSNKQSPIYPAFLFDDAPHDRSIKVKNGEEIIKLPENIFAFAPSFNTGDSFVGENSVFDFYRVNNFIGGGIMFFFIGDEVSTNVGGDFLTGKFLTTTNDTAAIENGKINGYDVIGTGSSFVEFLNAAESQTNPAIGETIGKKINFGVNIDNNLKFNFNKVKVKHTKGEEFQKELSDFGQITRDYQIQSKLLGPFSLSAGGDNAASAGISVVDQFGNSVSVAKAGIGNNDVRSDGTYSANFASWNQNTSEQHDGYDYTHVIYQNEVDSVSPTIQISLLRDTEQSNDDTLGRTEPAGLVLQFDVGFDGDYEESLIDLLDKGVNPRDIILNNFRLSKNAAYYGIVEEAYINSPYSEIILPKNNVLKNAKVSDVNGMTQQIATDYGLDYNEILYPNQSWKEVRRYIKIKKSSYETESALIQRDCSLNSVTEKINSNFNYPFCSLVGTTLDARSFSSPPVRTYDAKLKKILIPSNYAPLKADGTDKRFVEESSNYGLRDVVKFGANSRAIILDAISIGTDNFEISFKFKCDTLITSGFGNYIFQIGPSSSNDYLTFFQLNGQFVLAGNSPGITNDIWIPFTFAEIGANASDIFEVSIKCVDRKYTMDIMVNGVLKGSKSSSYNNARRSFTWDDFRICSYSAITDVEIADFKIKKNNQLLHFFDGTVIDTTRSGPCLKDKFGGSHAELQGAANGYSTVKDSTFKFGKNKDQVYIGEWDGTLKYSWSDNPAWILYDLMVNPVYGIRNQIDDLEDIDIFELYEIGKYCDGVDSDGCFDGLADDRGGLEPRFSCNIMLNSKQNAFNLIGNIASIFRSVTYWGGGAFNFSIDRPKEPTAIFNNSNVLDGSFSYGDILKQSRFTRVEVFYADKNDFYKIKKEFVEDEDRIRKYGVITNTQNGIGATSRSQARRLGKYILLSNKLETEVVEFSTDQSALLLSPGDIIRIDDDLKNFEINYGKILGSSLSANEFYVELENTLNTGSIKTGDGSAIYLYKDEGQTEIQDLYDIVKYDQTYEFGEDYDQYSGVLNSEKIKEAYSNFVFKSEITGISLTNNSKSIKLNLKIDEDSSLYGSGIKNGSPFNLKLNNEVNEFYKITSVKEQDNNIYIVNGLQYEVDKFKSVELEDYQEIEEAYNIGVPSNRINRPSPPDGFSTGIQSDGGIISLTGLITGNVTGSESKYRVSLNYPNGSYSYKEFIKNTDNSPPITYFSISNLAQAGEYDVTVTSMKNPESADSPSKSFTINALDFSSNISFDKIILNKEAESNQQKTNNINYKTGESVTENDNFSIYLKDSIHGPISFSSPQSPYFNIKLFDKENNYVKDLVGKYRSAKFDFSQLKKYDILEDQRFYTLGFYLYNQNDELKDTYMYSVENKSPNLFCESVETFSDKLVFSLNLEGSLDAKKIDVYSSHDGDSFSKLKTENILNNQPEVKLPVSYSEIKTYNSVQYKFLPHDIIGTGNWSNVVTGSIEKQQETSSSQIPLSQISQQLNQSLVSVYFAQFNQDLSGEYYSNGSQTFDFKQFDGDGRELGYNVILESSYVYSGSSQERNLSLNGVTSLNLSSSETSDTQTSYKKKKSVWQDYGENSFSLDLDNYSGIVIDQVNLEIEKFYK